jgi:hypothetical protein
MTPDRPDVADVDISQLIAEQAHTILPELVHLLQDATESGASVGFLPPLRGQEAQTYRRHTMADADRGRRSSSWRHKTDTRLAPCKGCSACLRSKYEIDHRGHRAVMDRRRTPLHNPTWFSQPDTLNQEKFNRSLISL